MKYPNDPIAQTYYDQLEESWAKKVAMVGGLAAGVIAANIPTSTVQKNPIPITQDQDSSKKMVDFIKTKYKVPEEKASQFVELAKKHEKDTFPKASDLIAVMAVESSFRPEAKSKLKHDPALGLMQVRPKVHGMHKDDLATPDQQIEHGANILHQYFQKLGSQEHAIHAYNVGITNLRRGTKLNPAYVEKVKKEKSEIET